MEENNSKPPFTLPENLEGYLVDGVEFIEVENKTREVFESKKIVGLIDPVNEKDLIYYAARNELWHIVRKDSLCFADELLLSLTLMDKELDINGEGLIDNMKKRPFDLYQFDNSMEVAFFQKNDWDKILSSYEIFSGGLPSNEMVKTVVPLVMDEFFTNAIYNAPVGKIKGWEEHRTHTKITAYKFPEKGVMRVACGEDHILVECMDPFGTFDPVQMLRCIKKTYDVGIASAIRSDENLGAGIGLRMVWERSISLGAIVEKDKFCTFYSVIPYRIPSKSLSVHPKNFHLVLR